MSRGEGRGLVMTESAVETLTMVNTEYNQTIVNNEYSVHNER